MSTYVLVKLLSSSALSTSMAMAIWILVISTLFASTSAEVQRKPTGNITNNPADELVAVINSNRTSHNSSSSILYDNPGLACIALQYIKAYAGNCGDVGGPKAKKPADSEFAETFAPNCGVLATSLAPLTGRLLGCETKYVQPSEAFSHILMKDSKALGILYSKNHTEIGAAVSGSDGGSPFFWCVLFSGGTRNGSFLLEDGSAKIIRPGCFSGADDDCSVAARDWSRNYPLIWLFALGAYFFGL